MCVPAVEPDWSITLSVLNALVLGFVLLYLIRYRTGRRSKDSRLTKNGKVYTIGKMQIFSNVVLGTGSRGTVVYEGRFENRPVAIKRLVKPFFGEQNANKEIELLINSDNHPNVLRYHAKEEDTNFIYIALEKCNSSLMNLDPDTFTTGDTISVLRHILLGLAHLHSLNIVHRDLKPANILISLPTKTGKIADMGLGKKLDAHRSSFDSTVTGSVGWQVLQLATI